MSARPLDPRVLAGRVGAALEPRYGAVSVTGVTPLAGGTSSLTYVADVVTPPDVARRVVVKVAPAGLDPVGNRDVLRQARVIRVLGTQPGIAVPEVLGTDPGEPPEVPPLFAMAFVAGESVEPLHDPPSVVEPALACVPGRIRAAVDMLAALQQVPTGQLEEQATSLEAEIARWERAFGTVRDELAAPAAECAAALSRSAPTALDPVVVHGDYRLGNMLAQGTTIAAVIDWEVWSVGDPRLDLAWFLNMVDPDHPGVLGRYEEVPTLAALEDAYAAATGRRPSDMTWFRSLVRYRQAAMSALIGKRARKEPNPDRRALEIEGWVPPLLASILDDLG